MADSDGDIEYLDEDADIVQQCVQNVPLPVPAAPELIPEIPYNENIEKPVVPAPLLVERTRSTRSRSKRKRPPKLAEDDSDYDPRDDASTPTSNSSSKKKKKKPSSTKKAKPTLISHSTPHQTLVRNITSVKMPPTPISHSTPYRTSANSAKRIRDQTLTSTSKPPTSISHSTADQMLAKNTRRRKPDQTLTLTAPKKPKVADEMIVRKKMEIVIPDYEDPLCLPVRAVYDDDNDVKTLNHWNNACLEHLRTSDIILRPENGKTVSSMRSITLKIATNPDTGDDETNISSKTCVENEDGVKKSQIFYKVLPKYRGKNVLDVSRLPSMKKPMIKRVYHRDEAILTKECTKNEDSLVIYKPMEAISAVYKLMAKDSDVKVKDEASSDSPQRKLRMTEVACCKMCAPCYQTSWRGVKGVEKRPMSCPICGRSSVSVYNLLTHVKTHDARAVRKKRTQLAAALKQVVDYHYKCRICSNDFLSIRELRQHVATHRGEETFLCEIGNHMAS